MMVRSFAVLSLCLVLASVVSGQRPFYAPNPWYDKYGPQEGSSSLSSGGSSASSSSSTTTTSSSNPISGGGLGDRFLTPVEGNVSFRYYNNVPIQGPDTPCVGCTYTLTRNGFVKSRR